MHCVRRRWKFGVVSGIHWKARNTPFKEVDFKNCIRLLLSELVEISMTRATFDAGLYYFFLWMFKPALALYYEEAAFK